MARVRWEDLERNPIFEDMVSVLLSRLHPGAERIDGVGGDGGRDVQLRENGRLDIFELKSFTGRVTSRNPNRRKQVEKSLTTAAALGPHSWTLVVPINHNPYELEWFDGLRQKYSFPLRWNGRDWLDQEMARFDDIHRYYVEGHKDEVIQLIRELNREEAVIESVTDAVGRFEHLQSRLNLIDPQYSFEITNGPASAAAVAFPSAVLHMEEMHDAGPITVSILAKYRDAPRDRPIMVRTIAQFPDTEVGKQALERFRAFLDYGDPTELDPAHLKEVRIDAPGGLGGEVGPGYLRLQPLIEDIAEPLDSRLITLDPNSLRLASLAIRFKKRYRGPAAATLQGEDPTGVIQVTLRLSASDLRGQLDISVVPNDNLIPAALLAPLRLARSLQTPNLLSVTVSGAPLLPPQPLQDMNLVTEEYLRLVEQLARIQAETNTSFPVSSGIDAQDASTVHRIIRLLDGEAIEVQPREWTTTLRGARPEQWVGASDNPLSIGFEAAMTETLMDEEVPLGICLLTMWPVTVEVGEISAGEASIRIVPAADTRATLRRGPASTNPPPSPVGR